MSKTSTVGRDTSEPNARGECVRRNHGAILAELRIPSDISVGECQNEEKKDSNFLIRLTTNRSWDEAQKDLVNEMGYSHLWQRLNQIENILGSTYNLKELERVWKERYKGGC